MTLPFSPERRFRPKSISVRDDRVLPMLAGLGIMATGALLSRKQPSVLDLPSPVAKGGAPSNRAGAAAARVRDGASTAAPGNLGSSIGRSLMIGGAAMMIARVLDEVISD